MKIALLVSILYFSQAFVLHANPVKMDWFKNGLSCEKYEFGEYCSSSSKKLYSNFTYTKRGQKDDLSFYTVSLKKKRVMGSIVNKIIKTETRQINGNRWVVSKQRDSEVPGFFTTYYATVKRDQAVLISLSYKDISLLPKNYLQDFEKNLKL